LEESELPYQDLKILLRIATQLNSAVDLNAALQLSLKETIDLLGLQTGWIWLLHTQTNSVFLAASYNLPPAFTQHPERLSGWCYCIEKYLYINEITCSRLKDLQEGTNGLRYHATVPLNDPLIDQKSKLGLLNLVSQSSRQLTKQQLELLHIIGEMISMAIKRTRLYEQSREIGVMNERQRLSQKFQQNLNNLNESVKELSLKITDLQQHKSLSENGLSELQALIQNIQHHSSKNLNDVELSATTKQKQSSFQYPISPLTQRELEVLNLLKKGKTNKAIAKELFISERTVKFHVSILLNKLNAKNRTDALQIALRLGIVEI